MAVRSNLAVRGSVHLRAWDQAGRAVFEERGENLFVNLGLAQIVHLLGGAPGYGPITAIGVGTSSSVPTPPGSVTGLSLPPGNVVYYFQAADITYPTIYPGTLASGFAQVVFSAIFTETQNNFAQPIVEVGLSAPAGPPLSAQVLVTRYLLATPFQKTASLRMQITYTLGMAAT